MPPRPIAAARALWLIALVGTSCVAADPVERCDIGPSPDSPDFDSYNAQRSALHARLGYEPVCED